MIILGPQYLFVGRPRKLFAPELRAYSRTVLNQGHPLIQANIANIHVEEQENIEVPKITSNLSALGQDMLARSSHGRYYAVLLLLSYNFQYSPFWPQLEQRSYNFRQTNFKDFPRNFKGQITIFKE